MQKSKYQLILASQSPRRKELLAYSGLDYLIIPSSIEEITEATTPEDIVQDLAYIKAKDIFDNHLPQDIKKPFIIGADTIVALDNEILGKPKDKTHAREMLSKLSGREHLVLTGVCFITKEIEYKFYCETKVQFDHITEDLMDYYLNTSESLDKAGAYGIQAHALAFIGEVQGSYSNVVGLPINLVIKNMKDLLNLDENWREHFV